MRLYQRHSSGASIDKNRFRLNAAGKQRRKVKTSMVNPYSEEVILNSSKSKRHSSFLIISSS